MGMYRHISRDDRAVIAACLKCGESFAEIGGRIGKDASSVWREARRNRGRTGYAAAKADAKARARRAASKEGSRLVEGDAAMAARIGARLTPLVSPEVAAREEGLSPVTVYAWLYRSRPDLVGSLPQRGRKRRRYGSKRAEKQGWTRLVRPIGERPAEAEGRRRARHFEGDTVRGRNGHLLTHTERKSRFEVAHLVPDEGSDAALAAISRCPELKAAATITYDRGSTFAQWRAIEEATGARVYFANAHHPWERGTNENANGRLRRAFPKGFDFGKIDQNDVDSVVWIMNHTPRKCLGWRTPCSVYGRCCTSN
jgi:IS30 family transposase